MSDSVQPHRWQPTRLPHPWDSPGKNTGVGCHFLLQCMKVKSESEDAQSCPTLSDPMDCSTLGSSDNGIFQARVLEWVAIAFSKKHTTSLYINIHTQQVRWRKIKQWGGREDRKRSGKVAIVGTRGPEGSGGRGQALCAYQEEWVLRWDNAQQD